MVPDSLQEQKEQKTQAGPEERNGDERMIDVKFNFNKKARRFNVAKAKKRIDQLVREQMEEGEYIFIHVPWNVRVLERLSNNRRGRIPRDLILRKDRRIEVRKVVGPTVKGTHGLYGQEAKGMYWNPTWIPPGHISVHTQDDPEPIHADRKPRGYNAKFLEIHTGDFPVHTMGGGLKSRGFDMNWYWLMMIGGGGIVVGWWLLPMLMGGA